MNSVHRVFAALGGWCFDHRWIVIAAAAAACAGAAWVASSVRIDNSYEAFFAPGDPTYRDYLAYREEFGSDEVSYLLYEAPASADGVFDLEVMRAVAELAESIRDEVPFVYEVTSLADAELLEPTEEGIRIRRVWRDFPHTPEAMREARALFLSKPHYVGSLVTADGRFGAVSIDMDRTSTDPLHALRVDASGGDALDNLYPQAAADRIEQILARPQYAGLRFYHAGDVPSHSAINRIIEHDTGRLQLLSSAVIAAVLALFLRSAIGVLGPLIVVQLAVVSTVAFIAAADWKLDMMFGSAPSILVTVGVAEAVHVLVEFRRQLERLGNRRRALTRAMVLVGGPCLLTSTTTAIGFLALGVSPIVGLAHLSVYSAVGVMAAFALTVTLLPALLSFGPIAPRPVAVRAAPRDSRLDRALAGIAGWNRGHSRAVLLAFGATSVIGALGIWQLRVDSNWLDDLSSRVPVKEATLRVDAEMSGLATLVYIFDTGVEDGLHEPASLRAIEALAREAERRGEFVAGTFSIADVVKELNQALHGGDPAHHAIPDSRAMISQLLLLYETSGGEEIEEWVSADFSRAVLELRTPIAPVSRTAELVEQLDGFLADHPSPGIGITRSGIGALWLELLDDIVASQIESFAFAFALIGLTMCAVFRSWRTGLLAMIPNLWPLLVTLGAMGWLGIPLDYNKVMIASVGMGIAVDDTVHFVSRYRQEFARRRRYADALGAIADVGRAVWVISLVLVLGFLVNTLSLLDAIAQSGILLAATIATALVADLWLTPALVLTVKPFGPERQLRDASEVRRAA